MKIIEITKNETTYRVRVDDEDYPRLARYLWTWRSGYACTLINRKYYQMHRMIMGAYLGEDVIIDHIDGDHTNNQRANLRRANRFENQQNRKTNRGNRLPKGIRQMPSGRFNVRIQSYNQRIVFGSFATLEEAIEARNQKAQELHGEFFRASHPVGEECS